MDIVKAIIEKLVTKKKLVGWIAAALIPIVGTAIALDPAEVKSAICDVK